MTTITLHMPAELERLVAAAAARAGATADTFILDVLAARLAPKRATDAAVDWPRAHDMAFMSVSEQATEQEMDAYLDAIADAMANERTPVRGEWEGIGAGRDVFSASRALFWADLHAYLDARFAGLNLSASM